MDNVQPTNVTSPASFAFRTEDRGTTGGVTVQTPVTLIDIGGVNAESLLSPANPLPVTTGTNGQGESVENPATCRVVGDPDGQFAGMDLLESVIDPNTGLTVQVAVKNPPLADSRGAQIPSDCAGPFILNWAGTGTAPLVIDTTGYQTIVVQNASAATLTPTVSNDGINFIGTISFSAAGNVAGLATIAGAGVYLIPVTARFFKLVAGASTVSPPAVVYLRQTPFNQYGTMTTPTSNITQVNSSLVSPGIAGNFPVIGATQVGLSANIYPVAISGADVTTSTTGTVSNLVRTMRVDTQGRPQVNINLTSPDGTIRQAGHVFSPAYNVAAAAVQDITKSDDNSSIVEVLSQLLVEQRITNLYLYNLANNINQGLPETDDPFTLRANAQDFSLN